MQNHKHKRLFDRKTANGSELTQKMLQDYDMNDGDMDSGEEEHIPCAKWVSVIGGIFLKSFEEIIKAMPDPQTTHDLTCLDAISVQAIKISNLISNLKTKTQDIKSDNLNESIKKLYKANPSLDYIKKAAKNLQNGGKSKSKNRPRDYIETSFAKTPNIFKDRHHKKLFSNSKNLRIRDKVNYTTKHSDANFTDWFRGSGVTTRYKKSRRTSSKPKPPSKSRKHEKRHLNTNGLSFKMASHR